MVTYLLIKIWNSVISAQQSVKGCMKAFRFSFCHSVQPGTFQTDQGQMTNCCIIVTLVIIILNQKNPRGYTDACIAYTHAKSGQKTVYR